VQFGEATWFALTGAGCEAKLDGKAVWTGWRYPVQAGQKLVLKRPQHGMRSYLAVAGGLDVPEVLGSCSTDLKTGLGGLEGRLLRDGDEIPLRDDARTFKGRKG
jgi:allophanate hydrolase subunit 2